MPPILSVPGTVISSLARKVTSQITTQLGGADNAGNNTNITLSQMSDIDTLDDSMRKVNKYVRKTRNSHAFTLLIILNFFSHLLIILTK